MGAKRRAAAGSAKPVPGKGLGMPNCRGWQLGDLLLGLNSPSFLKARPLILGIHRHAAMI